MFLIHLLASLIPGESRSARLPVLVACAVAGTSALAGPASVSAVGPCTVSVTDQSIDADEQAVFVALNAYRLQNGVPAVSWSPTLKLSSAWQSRDMATNKYFSHTDSAGRSPGTRMTDCGYTNPYTWRGENIAAGQPSADAVMAAWKGSSGHNALMLDSKYVAVGIGRVYDSSAPYGYYWTLDAASALDGTVIVPTVGATAVPTQTSPPAPTAVPTSVPATATTVSLASPTRTPTTVPTQVPPTGGSTGGGLLTNPGFESGLTGWDRPNWMSSYVSTQNSVVHSGSQSLRFQGKAQGPYAQQSVAASSGQTVKFSGWVNVPVRNQGMDGGIELQAYGSSGGTIGSATRVYSFETTTGGWVFVSGSHQMPAGASSVKLKIRFMSLDGTVYLDDVSMVP